MLHYFMIFFVFIILLLILGISVLLGRKIGSSQLKNHAQAKLEIVGVAESAVFGLLALLIAFTFSGAYDRYESRKIHLVEEADIFDRAYNYIDLVPENIQPELRIYMRAYFEQYIAVFKNITHPETVRQDLAKAQVLEDKIWFAVVAATKESSNKALPQIYIPVINDMFEAAHTGYYLTRIHPPLIIFALLIGLAVLGAFLVGYNSAENKQQLPIHSLCYILLTAITIYIIMNMEYARVGFIGLDAFDEILIQMRNKMV